jgi:hypothetical protein
MHTSTSNDTVAAITDQVKAHGIEFGKRYRDKASGFEGVCVSLYYFEHGCCRACLRGASKTTGEPVEATFDAPDLLAVDTEQAVPKGPRTGGPHGLGGPPRQGVR